MQSSIQENYCSMKQHQTFQGVISDQGMRTLIDTGHLTGAEKSRIQPASIDLDLNLNDIFELSSLTFPRHTEKVDELMMGLVKSGIAKKHSSTTLMSGKYYFVRLNAVLRNSPFFGKTNPKSSTGRTFNHCRLIADNQTAIDEFPAGYSGGMATILAPKFFPITLVESEPLSQLRFFSGDARLNETELRSYLRRDPIMVTLPNQGMFVEQESINVFGGRIGEVGLTADLSGACYRTKRTERPLVLSDRTAPWKEYFELIDPDEMKYGLLLEQGRGYLIGSRERFRVPHDIAVVVTVSDKYGEVKIHFAGFVDPLFGDPYGNSITLEMISHEPNLLIRHGQQVGGVQFEWMSDIPTKGYSGNYKDQKHGAKLPKFFSL